MKRARVALGLEATAGNRHARKNGDKTYSGAFSVAGKGTSVARASRRTMREAEGPREPRLREAGALTSHPQPVGE